MFYSDEQNEVFRGWEPFWANACVGKNGNPQIREYAEGYASGANVLLDKLISDGEGLAEVDILIYPICFGMRHALELYLKDSVVSLERLARIRARSISEFDMAGSHDIGRIWDYVRKESLAADARYATLIAKLDPFVDAFSRIDSTGQVFRYAFDNANNKHLTRVSVINVVVLKEKWSVFEVLLKDLMRLNDYTNLEYSWGGFTSKLSRQQLARLAKRLPEKSKWSTEEFTTAKKEIMAEYQLSGNDFSRALNLIKSRRDLSGLYGNALPIAGVSLEEIIGFLDIYLQKHSLEKMLNPKKEIDSETLVQASDFAALREHSRMSGKLARDVVTDVSPETFAAVAALFNFDREYKFSEVFDDLLKENLEEAATYSAMPKLYVAAAQRLIAKTGLLKGLLASLDFLGHAELASQLADHYEFKEHLEDLIYASRIAKESLLNGPDLN